MSNYITIQKAANKLGVSTKTLRRWEESGYLIPERQEGTGFRLYHSILIDYWKKLFDLRRVITNHLRMLREIRNALDIHTTEQNYIPGKPLKMLSEKELDEFMKACNAEEEWKRTYERLLRELREYPLSMRRATSKEEK